MTTKNVITWILIQSCFLTLTCQGQTSPRQIRLPERPQPITTPQSTVKIQVALLLDCSNSMDGLIEQAKSRLWNIVNTLTTLKYDGQTPTIEISLYQYGNDNLNRETNWVKQITPFTTDLDLISEKLFGLTTNGGEEYCGAAIRHANMHLQWNPNPKSMKLIYIAGNEAFDQGCVPYKDVILQAKRNNIYVNTIFCGDEMEGIRTYWQDGAITGNGKYFHINSNEKTIYIHTPYDDEISRANQKLNTTYLGYGRMGATKKMNQERQDMNAVNISSANVAERAVAKSKANVYKNTDWDIVDKVSEDAKFIEKAKEEELPTELKGKSKDEMKRIIDDKSKERAQIQKQIADLAVKRQQFIDAESKKASSKATNDLGKAIEQSIVEIANQIGYGTK